MLNTTLGPSVIDDGERLVSMVTFKNTIYVATNYGVYRLVAGELHRIKFVNEKDDIHTG